MSRSECVQQAIGRWTQELSTLGGESALRDLDALADSTLDLSSAHPGGMAQFLAGRPTLLSNLVREPSALGVARRRARVVRTRAAEHARRYSVGATTAALGVISWNDPGAEDGEVPMRVPVFLRPVDISDGAGGATLHLRDRAVLNPALEHALTRLGLDLDALVAPVLEGSSDLRAALEEVRAMAPEGWREVEVTEQIVVGSFAHPGQLLADDLLGNWLDASDLVAALAGDLEAQETYAVAVPPLIPTDRDPGTERGVGDLDVAQQHVLDAVASGLSVVVDAPPGSPTTATVAAIVADAAASGRTVMHVPGTRRATEALVGYLGDLGLGDLVLDASGGATQGKEFGGQVTRRLGAPLPPLDAAAITRMRGDLIRLREILAARVRAWHTENPRWQASPYQALQALAELTALRPAPQGRVRLDDAALETLAGRGLADARGELAKAGALGAFRLRRNESPWYGVRLTDAEHARWCVAAVQRLATRTLPALRKTIDVATAQTGLERATTLATWVEQVRMLEGVREALDVFVPAIFERSSADLIAATAPRSEREEHEAMPPALRRRLRKQARDLLRPGRHVADLHAELIKVQAQREIWQIHCPAGGWPRLPDSMNEVMSSTQDVLAAVTELDAPLRGTVGDGATALTHLPLTRLGEHLLDLVSDEAVARALPERTEALTRLQEFGLDPLLEDLADRRVPASLVAAELDLAWWSSVLERIIAAEPALQGATSYAQDVERLRELDRAQVESLLPPVALATTSYLRQLATADKDRSRELFIAADEARRGLRTFDLRELRGRFGAVGRAVLPCWSVPAMVVPQVLAQPGAGVSAGASRDLIDLVILDSVQNLTTAQLVSAMARGRQVVAVGDVRRGGSGVIRDLAEVLPAVALFGERTDRDERLTAFLAEHGYADSVVCIPSPPGPSFIRLDVVAGTALAVQGGIVETVPEEVEHVVDLVIDHALSRPSESLSVIALNARHAARIREAVALAVSDSPAVAEFFDTTRTEPFTVVDVEQAAGMRRDAVVLAVGFGKTPHGRVIHQFGPISTARGVSLLVDVLEACRRRLTVTSCLAPSDLDTTRLRSAGPRMLADLLTFAQERGEPAPEAGSREGTPDPLLVDLADRLWRIGLDVSADYGPPNGVHVPLAVGHPSVPGALLVAVLTDTPDYVATPSLRTRDRYWVERLEDRGWAVVALSALDVFLDPQGAAEQILAKVARMVHEAGVSDDEASHAAPPRVPEVEPDVDEEAEIVPVASVLEEQAQYPQSWQDPGHDDVDPVQMQVAEEPEAAAQDPDEEDSAPDEPATGEVVQEARSGVQEQVREIADPEPASRPGQRPDLFPGLAVTAYSERELDRMTAWVMSDGVDRDVDEIIEVVQAELRLATHDARVGVAIIASIDRLRAPQQTAVDGDGEVTPRLAPENDSERVLPDRAWEDDDRAWGEGERDDDERILRERPPHWE